MLVILVGAGSPVASDPTGDIGERIDAWIQPYVDAGHLSGCILVARGDEVIYERCVGMASHELAVPNTPETRFGIASVTKPLQLILLSRLVEEGALALTDTLDRWIPDFPRGDEITVLNLANHTAAVPHRLTTPEEETEPRTAADMVALVKEQGLLGDPGGERVYSSGGFAVLARVLELAGDDTWPSLMERYVFGPAGMTHTVHPEGRRPIPGRAASYRWTPDGLRLAAPKDLSFLVGGGSLYSTPRDVWRCVRTVLDDGYGETTADYVVRGRTSWGWNGVTGGYRTLMSHDGERDLTVVISANIVTGAIDRVRDAIPALVEGEAVDPPEVPEVTMVRVSTDELERYEGRYQLRPGSILEVRARGELLYSNDWIMIPVGTDRFWSPQDYGSITFVRDDAGAMHHMEWGEGFEIPRVGDL